MQNIVGRFARTHRPNSFMPSFVVSMKHSSVALVLACCTAELMRRGSGSRVTTGGVDSMPQGSGIEIL
jgi:hypothetical protein